LVHEDAVAGAVRVQAVVLNAVAQHGHVAAGDGDAIARVIVDGIADAEAADGDATGRAIDRDAVARAFFNVVALDDNVGGGVEGGGGAGTCLVEVVAGKGDAGGAGKEDAGAGVVEDGVIRDRDGGAGGGDARTAVILDGVAADGNGAGTGIDVDA